ncbi:helicase-related protein [Occultella gossypii]|uniref:Helicase ATP-binding domain-containing protein n=1 Tax=Occultella gossypii TaxID=2800820 RepID=A0ABS7S818_9MICO|nr:helicase-related protein [Occultella gossypii]MBZ2195416.1 hypothetical protein [Occultella gossypii]
MRIDVDQELSRLRTFQRDTADYAFGRLFGDGAQATSRFLVADEVGLGKTMVARGVIARTIEHLQNTGDQRVDIVYICSNGAIAAQNLRKLAPTGVPVEHRTERLPLLAFKLSAREHRPINLIALTPGTSLNLGSTGGIWTERAAVLRALQQLWGGHRVRGRGIWRIFAGGIGPGWHESPEARIRDQAEWSGDLSDEALEIFGNQVDAVNSERAREGLDDLDTVLHRIAARYARDAEPDRATRDERNRLIGQLREALAMTGAYLLRPDMVVLDEFQRFRDILHGDTSGAAGYAADIASHLFSFEHTDFQRTTRVLMLSATPYVMHTTTAESATGGDEHYADFLATYSFLADGLPGADRDRETAELRRDLARLRGALVDAASAGVASARAAADAVSARLRRVMVRTERLAATPDRDGMLREVREDLAIPDPGALQQYAAASRTAAYIAQHSTMHDLDIVEFWKSAPYTLSYLGAHGYKLAGHLRELVGPDAGSAEQPVDAVLASQLQKSAAVLPWEQMRIYERIEPAHSGLTKLWSTFFEDAGAERLLWLPPALAYYRAGGPFEVPAARRLTKRLVFSSWNLVPTAVATLTTYESERRLHEAASAVGAPTYDYDATRRSVQHLRFAPNTESMANLQFVVPALALARLGDPYAASVALRADGVEPTLESVTEHVRGQVSAAIEPLVADRPVVARGGGSTAWYTLVGVLLDGDSPHRVRLAEDDSEEDGSLLAEHRAELERLWEVARGGVGELPPVPADLVDMVTLASLAGPVPVLIRAFERVLPRASDEAIVGAAVRASDGFRTLFNSPEGTRVIDSSGSRDDDYWHRVLRYCAEGNLQSVIDEYVATLVENRGHDRTDDADTAVADLADDVLAVLRLRTPVYRPAVMTTDGEGSELRWHQIPLRGHFAMRYGSESTEEKAEQRAETVALAFNSPFWPFVLATTSVGQEGLDFHVYSHAVTHWNLPGNPVDLEQREGRVHRYKGHAVRKNVARSVPFPTGPAPWRELFASAEELRGEGDSDMIPFWVFAPASLGEDRAMIERHLPLTPYTRERSRIDPLLASVAMYRLAFGQPRQDEFLNYVFADAGPGLREELGGIRINLSPPRRGG